MISVKELKKLAVETGCLFHKRPGIRDYFIYYPNELFNSPSIDIITNSTIINVDYTQNSVWCYTKLQYDRLPWEKENYYNLVNGIDGDGTGKYYKNATYEQLKELVINTIKTIKETQQKNKINMIEKDFQ